MRPQSLLAKVQWQASFTWNEATKPPADANVGGMLIAIFELDRSAAGGLRGRRSLPFAGFGSICGAADQGRPVETMTMLFISS